MVVSLFFTGTCFRVGNLLPLQICMILACVPVAGKLCSGNISFNSGTVVGLAVNLSVFLFVYFSNTSLTFTPFTIIFLSQNPRSNAIWRVPFCLPTYPGAIISSRFCVSMPVATHLCTNLSFQPSLFNLFVSRALLNSETTNKFFSANFPVGWSYLGHLVLLTGGRLWSWNTICVCRRRSVVGVVHKFQSILQ